MAVVYVTLKVMPTGPDVDLNSVFEGVSEKIREFVDENHKQSQMLKEEEPIGFGLKALKITFAMDESIGSTEELENNIKEVPDVESVDVIEVRRALG
ncbi:elongation factor 1-beta [Candidatus Woesearchaeota archaeon]|nr:MAG: elongation factor 1-beta [Candidatus Woesearchaeota archaeon]